MIAALSAAITVASPLLGGPPAQAKSWDELADPCCENTDTIVLHLGKAEAVDLPRGAADVVISDPRVVDVVLRTARQPVLFGMRIGQANILFFDETDGQIRALEIRVEHDVALLNHAIAAQFPTARVTAKSVMGEIVLEGVVEYSHEAASIIDLSQRFVAAARAARSGDGAPSVDPTSTGVVNRIVVVNEEQIHLRVRVAEVDRAILKEVGVDWNAVLENSTFATTISLQTGNFFSFLSASASDVVVGPEAVSTFLKALEQDSLVVTLAEPSLTALSGETASFLAGGEYPVPVSSDGGDIAIEFKRFGVGLDFTPVVLDDGRISLKVKTEVSDLTDVGAVSINGTTVQALSVRRAESTVELPSGGTMMIGGLIQQSTRRISAGLPGLRKLPVLGGFFRTDEARIEETELVVLVTPILVRPTAPQDLAAPTDGFKPASDVDMFVFGRLHAVYGSGPEDLARIRADAEGVSSPLGFIME